MITTQGPTSPAWYNYDLRLNSFFYTLPLGVSGSQGFLVFFVLFFYEDYADDDNDDNADFIGMAL